MYYHDVLLSKGNPSTGYTGILCIIFERNSTISGESLNFNQEQSGKNNYIAGMENVPQNP